MKRINSLLIGLLLVTTITTYGQANSKLVSSKTHIKFYSHTALEDIEANNYASVSTINSETGAFVFSVPMQGFEFEKSQMQKHFNGKGILNTKAYPKSKIVGQIINFDDVDLSSDGEYLANVEGELSIKGQTNSVSEKGTITVKGNSIVVQSKFNITLVDYGVELLKGKPSTNVAKTVEVTVHAEYVAE